MSIFDAQITAPSDELTPEMIGALAAWTQGPTSASFELVVDRDALSEGEREAAIDSVLSIAAELGLEPTDPEVAAILTRISHATTRTELGSVNTIRQELTAASQEQQARRQEAADRGAQLEEQIRQAEARMRELAQEAFTDPEDQAEAIRLANEVAAAETPEARDAAADRLADFYSRNSQLSPEQQQVNMDNMVLQATRHTEARLELQQLDALSRSENLHEAPEGLDAPANQTMAALSFDDAELPDGPGGSNEAMYDTRTTSVEGRVMGG